MQIFANLEYIPINFNVFKVPLLPTRIWKSNGISVSCDTDLSEPQSEATHGILTLIFIMPESCLYVYLKMQQELSICKLWTPNPF